MREPSGDSKIFGRSALLLGKSETSDKTIRALRRIYRRLAGIRFGPDSDHMLHRGDYKIFGRSAFCRRRKSAIR
jgi:hypothetical protein